MNMNRRRTPIGTLALVTTLIVTTVTWNLGTSSRVAAGPPNADGHWVVDSTGDGADDAVGDGTCDDGIGNCTLRAALDEGPPRGDIGNDAGADGRGRHQRSRT